jgi:O-antigen/teichoic acid export membrane protein
MTLDVISIVAGAQIAIGIFRYYYKAETETARNAVVSTSFSVLAASYLTLGVATFLAAPWLSSLVFDTGEHVGLIRLAAMSLAASSLSIAPLTFFRVQERSRLFVTAQLARASLQVALNLLFLVRFDMGVEGVFLANLVASLVVGAVLAGMLVRSVGLHFSRDATRDLLRYGVPLIGTQLATFAVTFGDRYFLQAAADTGVVGLYSLAYQFGFLLAAVGYLPFEMIWEPVRFEIARRVDRDAVYAKGFIYLNLMLITMAVALALFVEDVLRIMATPAFYPAAQYVPLILIAYVLQGWTGLQDVGIHIRERTEFITLANWASAAVALVGYAIFVPRYLGMGAAGVTVAAFAVRYVGCYWASQRLWRVRYRWRPVLTLVALGVAAVFAGLSLGIESLWLGIAAKAAVLVVYAGAVLLAGIVPAEDLRAVAGYLSAPRPSFAGDAEEQ